MAVALDAAGSGYNSTNTTHDYTGITVGSGSDRALVLPITFGADPGTVT